MIDLKLPRLDKQGMRRMMARRYVEDWEILKQLKLFIRVNSSNPML
jgi:hypothetical protein